MNQSFKPLSLSVLLLIIHLMQGHFYSIYGHTVVDSFSQNPDLLVLFWNLENFFDYKDGGKGESDKEFSSCGSRRWTKKRFQAKCNAVAKSIYWMKDRYGHLPDIIGLAEIENSNVLYRLLKDTALKKTDYAFVHFDGSDRRGIDVALLYRKSLMTPVSVTRKLPVCVDSSELAYLHLPEQGGPPSVRYFSDTLRTREILHVAMRMNPSMGLSSKMDFIVNHHPSKYGGEEESRAKRMAAMATLKELCDSLRGARAGGDMIVAMGDFNDTPDSEAFALMEGVMVNKGMELHEKGLGSIRFRGKWDLIDMFMVSPSLDNDEGKGDNVGKGTGRGVEDRVIRSVMLVEKIPFLMVRDSAHPGENPLRTYSGPRYIGGVSDHCPVSLCIFCGND